MARNLSWIDRDHLRALVAQTTSQAAGVVVARPSERTARVVGLRTASSEDTGHRFGEPRPMSTSASMPEPLRSREELRAIESRAAALAGTRIEAPPSRPPAEPLRVAPTRSTRVLPSIDAPAQRTGSLTRAAAPSKSGRSSQVVSFAENSPVAVPEGLDLPPPPEYTPAPGPAMPDIEPFEPLRDAPLEEQLDGFIDWALRVCGLTGAFVADHEGLLVAERRLGDVDVALASIVEQMFGQLEPFLGAHVEGHVFLRNDDRSVVITWAHTEFGRFFAGLTGVRAPRAEALPLVAAAFGSLFPR